MKKHIFFFSTFFISASLFAAKLSYTPINQVLAVVGNIAITQTDLENATESFKVRKDIKKDKRNIESQVLDYLISQAVIHYTAKEESLTISDTHIQNEIKRQMESQGITDVEKLKALVQRELRLNWEQYRTEVENQLLLRQVMQIRVPVPPPSEEEVQRWYNKNKKQLGKKYSARIIQMRFKKGNYQDELRVSKEMNAAHAHALKNFSEAAAQYSQHASASQGGSIGWVRPEEVALQDPFLAGAIVNSPTGTVSQVFVGQEAYYIVKVEKSAPVTYDEVHNFITAYIYSQKEQESFLRWLTEERKRLSVQIFDENYRPN